MVNNTIGIKMALGIGNGLILFERKDKAGLYLGSKDFYKEIGKYTGKLLQICENEDMELIYTIYDLFTNADSPEMKDKIKQCYKILNS